MAMGDWDSFKGPQARKYLATLHHQTLPVDKDRSDFFYAACSALAAGATQIIALGVTGGRSDHHLGALFDLSRLAAGEAGEASLIAAYGPDGEYHFLSPQLRCWRDSFARPRTISIFALSEAARGVTLKGFKYAMKGGTIEPSSHGLSNRTWATTCEVTLTEGNLLVLIPGEKYSSTQHGA
jgi:thiamine pyrophosphokinase